MARIIGDYAGTTFKDFLILPGNTTENTKPELVDISTNIAGIKLEKPLLPAAMRSVVGKEMALAGSKNGTMPVAPRGLSIDKEVDIVRYVRDNEVRLGEIEIAENPVCIGEDATLAEALAMTKEFGHSNIPVKNNLAELVGIFTYKPITHDRMDPGMPIARVMTPFKKNGRNYCTADMNDEKIKAYMKENKLRFIPVIDEVNRLRKLVFMQNTEAYKIGAAIDTHPGWQERAERLVEAGANMIFTDTSDADSVFCERLIADYKKRFPKGPPLCAGNVVTGVGFRRLADAGADAIKVGMGPGSICTTNITIGVGAPPFWALREVCEERNAYKEKTGKYLSVIADGGIEDTWDINIALTHADAAMGGRLFAGCFESAGGLVLLDGKKYKEYWGEGSKRAAETSGDLKRYHLGGESSRFELYEGVDALVELKGYTKPVTEEYSKGTRLCLSHTGSRDLSEYRCNATLLRLSERAKDTAHPHGIKLRQ